MIPKGPIWSQYCVISGAKVNSVERRFDFIHKVQKHEEYHTGVQVGVK